MLSRNLIRPVSATGVRAFATSRGVFQSKSVDILEQQSTGKEIVSGAPKDLITSRVVRIYKESKPATQSGHYNGHLWKLDWDVLGKSNRWENDLMGYQGSGDYMQGTIMKFDTKEAAIKFAEGQGWDLSLIHI